MRTIEQILKEKGPEMYGIGPDDPVLNALRLMAEKHVGALLVLKGQTLVGILSERDYARKVILLGRSSADTPVSQIMSSPVTTVTRAASVNTCLEMMTDRRIRHLPVVENDRVLGVLSIGDLVKAVIDDQRHTIEDLERFIRS
ncbi:MAG TPA: CBS domain-containing protein [Steroidobacteraceae bacterium]|nr:CBS domain-containing protein [Steroidobacteraceae bacterium]